MTVGTFKLASVLLQYPTQAIFDGLGAIEEHVAAVPSKPSREGLGRFVAWLRFTDPNDVAEQYVRTFDLRRRCALYLTYPRYGDTRKRGMAMLVFKTAYRDAGFVPTDDELPDYLPMVLDFAALSPRGEKLLHGHRADLELLHRALTQANSPYAHVVAAVRDQLPGLGRRELAQVKAAWETGPPEEEVGLEPFAPPGYLSGQEAHR